MEERAALVEGAGPAAENEENARVHKESGKAEDDDRGARDVDGTGMPQTLDGGRGQSHHEGQHEKSVHVRHEHFNPPESKAVTGARRPVGQTPGEKSEQKGEGIDETVTGVADEGERMRPDPARQFDDRPSGGEDERPAEGCGVGLMGKDRRENALFSVRTLVRRGLSAGR